MIMIRKYDYNYFSRIISDSSINDKKGIIYIFAHGIV